MTPSPSLVQFFLSGGGGETEDWSMETPQRGDAGARSQPDDATRSGAASRKDGGSNPGTGSKPKDAVWLDYLSTELP